MKRNIKYIIIFSLVVGAIAIIKFFGLESYLNLESLKENKQQLAFFIENNFLATTIIYVFIYLVAVALSLPGATILTLGGGFMYSSFLGTWTGTLVAVLFINIGATGGAISVFVLVRYLIGTKIQEKYSNQLSAFNKEIEEYGTNYFLIVRFIPVFPFFLINILAGLTTVKLSTFACTTSLGIIPGSMVYAYAGSALNEIDSLDGIMNAKVIMAFILLGIFSIFPAVLKKVRKRKYR